MKEDKKTEFKREFTEDIKKTIVAFANTEGGNIYIGIEDNGSVCGVQDSDKTLQKITNIIHDAIRPDVVALTDCSCEEMNGRQIIKIEIQRGTARPYYLTGKGIRPEGVFIRHGASSIPASESIIRDMIRENAVSFENERALNQHLSFKYCTAYFQKKHIDFGESQKKTLGLIMTDETYSVLALLLSEQCPYSIKIALFQGTEKNVFRDRREITGSVLLQMEEAYEYINKSNTLRAEFAGLERIEEYAYPQEAIREALLNCIIHRDYAFSGPILISIFENRIEFVSIGGLVKGLKKEDIFLGISQPRNTNLANVFYRLKLIEAYGTGILKIKAAYNQFNVSPVFEITDNAFKITLPNTQYQSETVLNPYNLNKKEKEVLELFKRKHEMDRIDIENSLGVSTSTAGNILRKLEKIKVIERIGSGKNIFYRYLV